MGFRRGEGGGAQQGLFSHSPHIIQISKLFPTKQKKIPPAQLSPLLLPPIHSSNFLSCSLSSSLSLSLYTCQLLHVPPLYLSLYTCQLLTVLLSLSTPVSCSLPSSLSLSLYTCQLLHVPPLPLLLINYYVIFSVFCPPSLFFSLCPLHSYYILYRYSFPGYKIPLVYFPTLLSLVLCLFLSFFSTFYP